MSASPAVCEIQSGRERDDDDDDDILEDKRTFSAFKY